VSDKGERTKDDARKRKLREVAYFRAPGKVWSHDVWTAWAVHSMLRASKRQSLGLVLFNASIKMKVIVYEYLDCSMEAGTTAGQSKKVQGVYSLGHIIKQSLSRLRLRCLSCSVG
jgi:hypothetical protein